MPPSFDHPAVPVLHADVEPDPEAEPILEPIALLGGGAAEAAVAAGWARPLLGGQTAFAGCAVVGRDRGGSFPVVAAPSSATGALARLTAPVRDGTGLPPGPLVMGILNVTPDSFSDGGRFFGTAQAVAAGRRMIEAGADIVDVGGESTRPDADPVPPAIERERVLPVIRALAAAGARISIDSRNASTLDAALDAGAVLANDVSALRHDPSAAPRLAARGAPVCLMHMRGDPRTMAGLARYDDVAAEVMAELAERVAAAVAAGIRRDRILVDPGIGFSKTAVQNLELLRRLPVLANLGCRMVLGVSRKRFIAAAGGGEAPTDRLSGSLMALLPGLALPGTIFRVHDVAETARALRVWGAIAAGRLPG